MILVTGSTGFLGAHVLAHFCEKRVPVVGLFRSEDRKEHVRKLFHAKGLKSFFSEIIWRQGDVLDPASLYDALEGVDTVIHCAAKVSFKHRDQRRLYATNVKGTTELVNACLLQEKPPALLYVSSTSALDIPHLPKPEKDTPVQSKEHYSYYGLTKFLAELEVFRGGEEGLQVTCLNPGVIVGMAPPTAEINSLFRLARVGFPWASKALHGFTHIDHIVLAIDRALHTWPQNQNPVISENLRFITVQHKIATLLNRKKPSWVLRPRFAWSLYAISKGLKFLGFNLGLSRESIRTALYDAPVSCAEAFTFPDQAFSIFEGLKQHHAFSLKGK